MGWVDSLAFSQNDIFKERVLTELVRELNCTLKIRIRSQFQKWFIYYPYFGVYIGDFLLRTRRSLYQNTDFGALLPEQSHPM